jgi:regulator of sirC expression with transglutaminase-like and TPR domain
MTFATVFKERIAQMPNDINTKKDIEKYYKNLLKEIEEELKKDKPKKPLNPYQQFVKDMQAKIKKETPELNAKERFTKIAEEWQKTKN